MLRSFLVALLVLALVPVAALANTTVWASRTVLDRPTFSGALSAALDDPVIEADVATRLAGELYAILLQSDERIRPVLGQVLGLGTDAADAAIVGELRPLVQVALDQSSVRSTRDQLVADAHDALRGVERDGTSVRLVGDHFVVDVRPLLETLVDALGSPFTELGVGIPASADTLVRFEDAPGLGQARDGIVTLDRWALILPLLAILLALLVLVAAAHRARALGYVGIALVVAGVFGIGVVLFGGVLVARLARGV
jgi:hypothetical protein